MAFIKLGTAMALNGNGTVTVIEPLLDTIIMTPNGRKHAKPDRDYICISKENKKYVCAKTQFPALYWNMQEEL